MGTLNALIELVTREGEGEKGLALLPTHPVDPGGQRDEGKLPALDRQHVIRLRS